jgi:hypothetical protein
MWDYFPDLSKSFDHDNPEGNHDGWQSYDDPFEPLPVSDHLGMQFPDQQPASDEIKLSDEELNAMLPLLLNHQDQGDFRRVNSVIDDLALKNNPLAFSSHHCKSNSAAPKNTRNGRPAKRPLDGYSAFVRHERTHLISSINSNEKLHEAEGCPKAPKKKMKYFNSANSVSSSIAAMLQEPGGKTALSSKDCLAVNGQVLSHLESGVVPVKAKTNCVAGPLSYEVLQTYKTLEYLPKTNSDDLRQQQSKFEFPPPRWHWHDSSEPVDIPPPQCVTLKDSNGTPQLFKIVYAAITMPFDVANKFDVVALYESTKGTIESLFNNNNTIVNSKVDVVP